MADSTDIQGKVNSKIEHLQAKVNVKELQLDILLDITNFINRNFSTTVLLEKYKTFLSDRLNIEKLALFSLQLQWNCILSYGFSEEDLDNIDVDRDLLYMKEITSVNSEQKSVLAHFDIVIPVYHDKEPLAYLLLADQDNEEISVSRLIKHLNFLQLLTNIVVTAIEKQRLANEVLRQEKEKREFIERQKEQLARLVEERTRDLTIEKEETNRLLYNILPEELAEELKHSGFTTPMRYDEATIIFTDFKDFTKTAENVSPKKLVKELNEIFQAFDFIADRYHIEKIKTIGDAYMAVSGIPTNHAFHAVQAVKAAREMVDFITHRKQKGFKWQMRVGIHSGPLVAGVVGTKKFIYDVWGDSVNTAARMESSGLPDQVNISERTHELVKEYFHCSSRGKVEAKGKGKMKMFIVEEPRVSARYKKTRKSILHKLEKGLPENLLYHGIQHTHDVCEAAESIALREYIDPERIELIKVAALFHDAGFMKQYRENETVGCKIAKEELAKQGYSPAEIKTVTQMIMATQVPQSPKNKLDEILADADLDYLGRADFGIIAGSLREELELNGVPLTHKAWIEKQISFLQAHQYFTKTAKDVRQKGKSKQLEKLRAELLMLKDGDGSQKIENGEA